METRKDPHTGELFEPKRADQVFANRRNQIAFNNAKARKRRGLTRSLDLKLKKNRTLLERLLGEANSIEIARNTLLSHGFDFGLFNRLLKKGSADVYGVYEFYLFPKDQNTFEIGKLKNNGTSN